MATVAEHYDLLLAQHYSWLSGGLMNRVGEFKQAFIELGLFPCNSARALDLGCGSGFQAIPLAQMGFEVTAIDVSLKLLAELSDEAKGLPLAPVNADMLAYLESAPSGAYQICTCMGDTLTHLTSLAEVERLLQGVFRVLAPGGQFLVAFRDFTSELVGTDRFIPVRSDDRTIVTCFLEFDGDHVRVHDLVYSKGDAGWTLDKSAYRKLRISPQWVKGRLVEAGFTVEREERARGLTTLVLRKSSTG